MQRIERHIIPATIRACSWHQPQRKASVGQAMAQTATVVKHMAEIAWPYQTVKDIAYFYSDFKLFAVYKDVHGAIAGVLVSAAAPIIYRR